MRWAFWAAVVAKVSVAQAQIPTGLDLVGQALELRRAGRDLEALAVLERAWLLDPSPRVRAQVGFAEQALGRWLAADAHLRDALAANRDPWVAARRTIIDEALRVVGAHLGSLEVRSPTPDARIWLNDRLLGALPRTTPERVVAGAVTVELRAEGYITAQRVLEVPAGGVLRLDLALEPAGAESSGAAVQRVLAWAALGVSAVGMGVGFGLLAQRNAAARRWNDPLCQTVGVNPPAQCAADLDEGRADEVASIAGFVVGGVLLVTGVTLLATAPSASRRRALWCGPGPGVVAAECGVRF